MRMSHDVDSMSSMSSSRSDLAPGTLQETEDTGCEEDPKIIMIYSLKILKVVYIGFFYIRFYKRP